MVVGGNPSTGRQVLHLPSLPQTLHHRLRAICPTEARDTKVELTLGSQQTRQRLGLSAPGPSLHTHLIQEAIVQGQIGGRIGSKNGGCLFGTSHCQVPSCVVLEGIFRREGERERKRLESFCLCLSQTTARHPCPQQLPWRCCSVTIVENVGSS